MRSPFDALVTEKALVFISSCGQPELVDHLIDSSAVTTKNVCAKVSPELAAEIEEVVSLLGISKRRFLEAAFVEAVRRSREIMEAEGVYELLKLNFASAEAAAAADAAVSEG